MFFLTAFFLLINANIALAIDFEIVANTKPTGYVSDFADILKNSAKIENTIKELEEETTAEIAVVTINELPQTHTIEDFAVELFEKWGIGKKQKDNGILFLISINDRKFRIEVGYGLEGTITDLTAKNIAEKNFPPNFKNGNYDQGILDAIQDAKGLILRDQKIIDEYANNASNTDTDDLPPLMTLALIVFIILMTFFLSFPQLLVAHIFGSAFALLFSGASLLVLYLFIAFFAMIIKYGESSGGGGGSSIGSSTWSSGSSSGGFGGFGGGSSGGGGYSGGW